MTSFGIQRLALAMAEHEGWKTPGTPGFPLGSRSYRNNNPLNLRKSPFLHTIDDNFCVFRTELLGWAAAYYDLEQKCKGNTVTGLGPDSTLRQLIYVWAPVQDNNDPASYLQTVCHLTGFTENTMLKDIAA